ncbi:MAG: hypothetical protein Kow001_10940 [Acidobacteriota bacterium]
MSQGTGVAHLLPLERELQERWQWFIRLRWLAGAGILAGSAVAWAVLGESIPVLPLIAVGLAVLLYNFLILRVRERFAESLSSLTWSIYLQVLMDWCALTIIVSLTGGIFSPVSLTFVFHLIIGSILWSSRACYVLAATASGLLGVLAILTALERLPAGPRAGHGLVTPVGNLNEVDVWVLLTLFFLITTYLATSITARLREKEAALFASERALDRAYQEMRALYELGQLVNSTLDTREVLSLIAQNAARLLKAKASFIRLFDRSGRKLFIGGSWGLSQAYINKGPVEVEKSLVDLEALKGGTIQVYEVGDDARFQYREEARREGLRSMLSCPMRAKNRTLGVIRVYTAEPRRFTEQEESLLMNLANLGATAILNARAYSELQALNEARIWFARTTHHQLRSPLAAIQSALDALPFAGPLNERQRDLVARARRRIRDAFDLIRDLLDLAAAQRPQDATQWKTLDLTQCLRGVLDSARDQAAAKGLQWVEEIQPGPLLVRADPTDLERVFSNLLDNAVKYTPSGRVAIRLSSQNGTVVAEVEDTGIGIAAEDLPRIFDGFFRSQTAKATAEVGTGLGLSIVRQVVERLEGTIGVESTPGQGTRFTVRLPAAAGEDSAAGSAQVNLAQGKE